MNKLKLIKKTKAYFIRFRLHVIFGPLSNAMIFLGYLSKLSAWAHRNRQALKYNDFYNNNKSSLSSHIVFIYPNFRW